MKKLSLAILSAIFIIAGSINAFAGTWESSGENWKYKNDNGTYAANCWQWIDGKCYCFGSDGVMYKDCTTPDGYRVNKDGAWVDDSGRTQTQTAETSSSKSASSTSDRLYYLNLYWGLPGESEELKNQKMHDTIFKYGFTYRDCSNLPKTLTAYREFLSSVDWPNMTDREKVKAAFERTATGYHGNYYGSDKTGTQQKDIANGIHEDSVMAYHCGGCGQYTGAMQNLCEFMGMQTATLNVNIHGQTMVKVDGVWWVFNPTWAEGEPMEKHMLLFDSDERRANWPLYNDGTGVSLGYGRKL